MKKVLKPIERIVSYQQKVNDTSPIGTLIYLDSIAKYGMTDVYNGGVRETSYTDFTTAYSTCEYNPLAKMFGLTPPVEDDSSVSVDHNGK